MQYSQTAYFIVLLHAGFVLAALPSGWNICKKDAPNRNECLQKAITGAFKLLHKGVSELGIPPFDPVNLGEIVIKPAGHSLAPLNTVFHNFTVYNYNDMTVTKAELNGKNLKLECKFGSGPEAKGPYKMDGKVVSVRVFGDGDCYIKFVNTMLTVDMTFKDKPEVRDGKNYYSLEKFEVVRSVDRFNITLSHLEDDDKEIGLAMTHHLNSNWDVLWEDLRQPFEEALNKHHLDYANKVFSKISMEDLGLL